MIIRFETQITGTEHYTMPVPPSDELRVNNMDEHQLQEYCDGNVHRWAFDHVGETSTDSGAEACEVEL